MPNPNFMVIGTQKGGTSWLAKMMRQHPDIYVPEVKELHFFNLKENYEKGMDWYRGYFSSHQGEKAIGDLTPNYLWNCPNESEVEKLGVITDIPKLVHQHYPDLKLIVSLRNPVDRAISAFFHFMRARSYSPHSRIHDVGYTNGIITMGYYYRYISEWLKYYPFENFHFVVYEDGIKRNKLSTLRKIFQFLEVDEDFVPEKLDTKYNARMGHLFLYLNYYSPSLARVFFHLFKSLRPANFPKIELTSEEVAKLSAIYERENRGLSELIKCPVPW